MCLQEKQRTTDMVTRREKKKPEKNQIMTAENDITRNYIGRILLNPDKVLSFESQGKGIEIYEDMLYEARIFSEMQKRKLAVIGKEWDIEPASDDAQDVKVAEFIKEVFKKFSYDTARQALLSGIVTGFKPAEVMWDYSEGDIWIKSLNGGSPRRFVFDIKNNLRLLTWGNMIEGEEVPDRKFIIFRNPSDNNSPYGDGLGRPLYWPVWFKKNGVKFWAVFLDKFGQPTPWGKYPPGTKTDDQDKLLDALKAMQTDQAIITPENMAVELLEAARSSSVDSYDKWEKFWNDAITFIILGQSATTEGTPGKLGEEGVRLAVAEWIIKADADLLSECQNNFLIPWLCDYNFPGLKAYPKVWIRTEPEKDLKPLAERDRILIKEIGLPTPVSYVRDTYGIPAPEEGEEIIVPPQISAQPFGFSEKTISPRSEATGNDKRRTMNKKRNSSFAENDWIDFYISNLSSSLKNIRGDVLAKIETWLRGQSSPPSEKEFISSVQSILGDAYKKIDKTAITESIAGIYQAFKAAPGAELIFGGADIRAINFLGNLDHYYLSKFIDNPDAQAKLTEFLKTRYLEGGEGLFGAGDPAAIKEMQNLLAQQMTDLEGYQINRIADTGVQRVRNWAHISQLNDAGIAEIEIIEPTMECPFCAAMNGKIIQVNVAYRNMMDQANMTPEEYQEFLENNPPSLEGIEDYVDQGMLPPYHPHCRGTIIKRLI
jgi:phage gp29-like protein